MREITLEELLEAGCHFGHQVTRQNPKARDFVFEARDGIHIIDLAKTKVGLEEAGAFIRDLASRGGSLVVVGTKRQAQPTVIAQVKKAEELGAGDGLFSITNRWIGGILTNFAEVSKNFAKLADIEEKLKNEEERSKYTKKEIGDWGKEKQKLESFYGGISSMKKTPDALFIIDSHLEDLAVREAKVMGVPTVAFVDTNSDPEVIDYPIPANDDALGSVELIVKFIMDAWIEGKKVLKDNTEKVLRQAQDKLAKEEKKAVATESSSNLKKEKKVLRQAQDKPKKEVKTKTKTKTKKLKNS